MPVDYSKWDALELSDDSDFEGHPNVDKKSFIRAKQNQIHQQREQRKHEIKTLQYERIINDGLIRRIDTLLAELKSHEEEAKDKDAFLFQALIASAGDPDDDELPRPPEGVHMNETDRPRYSQMMGTLVDEVKKEFEESGKDDWFKGYIKGIEGHKKKVKELQASLEARLVELQKEETKKITSEHIRDGWNSSHVVKSDPKPASKPAALGTRAELLNAESLSAQDSAGSGAEADVDENLPALEDTNQEDPESAEPTELGKKFLEIEDGQWRQCNEFVAKNIAVLAERNTDGLLVMAFNHAMEGRTKEARHCVHQGLLLQYCRSLVKQMGPDGAKIFFKRISQPGHQSLKVFMDDVNSTTARIVARGKELAKERAENPQSQDIEQIQLQAVEPGTEIHFNVPQPNSEDDFEQKAYAVFETFPPNMQKALSEGSLEAVNVVLAKMSIDEAEEIVNHLSDYGMLDMRSGVIDTTTEEGQETLKQIHQSKDADAGLAKPDEEQEQGLSEVPPMD